MNPVHILRTILILSSDHVLAFHQLSDGYIVDVCLWISWGWLCCKRDMRFKWRSPQEIFESQSTPCFESCFKSILIESFIWNGRSREMYSQHYNHLSLFGNENPRELPNYPVRWAFCAIQRGTVWFEATRCPVVRRPWDFTRNTAGFSETLVSIYQIT